MTSEKQDVYTRVTDKIVADSRTGPRAAETVECWKHGGAHHQASTSQRPGLFRH